MTTHKQDLSKLSINQLSLATGLSYGTVKRRLAGLDSASQDGRTLYYTTPDALRRIFDVSETEKERLDRVRADKVDYDLSISKGEHLPIADVETLMAEATAIFTGQKRSMGSRLAGQLANMTDARAIMKLLNSENDKILRGVADKFSEVTDKGSAES